MTNNPPQTQFARSIADTPAKVHELEGHFEPQAKAVTTCLSDAALTSIAVSMKRIADSLTAIAKENKAQS